MAQKPCIFCRIIAHEAEAMIVFQDDDACVFLDTRPLFLGHCLLVPNLHLQTIYELPKRLTSSMFLHAQIVGKAIEQAMHAQGSFIAINNVVSQSVPHLHVHIVPRNPKDGLKGFFWPRMKYDSIAQMIEVKEQIQHHLTAKI